LAYKIAGLCYPIPFHFVQSWSLNEGELAAIRRRLKPLPNVWLSPSAYDVRDIYQETKILLIPSRWDEGWGRAVSEAQCSGIPALYSLSGGLPEAAGDGGIGLDRNAPAEDWAQALHSLWHGRALYEEKSARARAMSEKMVREKDIRLRQLLEFITSREARVLTVAA
jgi:glycosyltransferase involved in cell wall biosynthesis